MIDGEYLAKTTALNQARALEALAHEKIKCKKGLYFDHCPYNPRLGCDCGHHKPRMDNSYHQGVKDE